LFTRKDIERIAQYLKMKPGDFTEKYLRIDEDQDYVLQKTPCAFLKEDNYCSIYDVRPKACREYPHTDMQQMQTKLKITYLNATICPAVADILEKIKAKV
jgi:Fe-S-cluster containining protein